MLRTYSILEKKNFHSLSKICSIFLSYSAVDSPRELNQCGRHHHHSYAEKTHASAFTFCLFVCPNKISFTEFPTMVIIHILDRKRIKRSESTEKRGRNRENNELKIVDDKTVHLINVRSRYTFICILSPAGFAIRFCKAEKKTERIAENMKSNVCVCVLESNIRESNRKKNSYRGFHRVYTMQRHWFLQVYWEHWKCVIGSEGISGAHWKHSWQLWFTRFTRMKVDKNQMMIYGTHDKTCCCSLYRMIFILHCVNTRFTGDSEFRIFIIQKIRLILQR